MKQVEFVGILSFCNNIIFSSSIFRPSQTLSIPYPLLTLRSFRTRVASAAVPPNSNRGVDPFGVTSAPVAQI